MKNMKLLASACIFLIAAVSAVAAEKKNRDFTGWVGSKNEPVKYQSGTVKMILRGDVGSFQIYSVNNSGNEVPVFADYDQFMATYFSLLADRTEYRLNAAGGIKTQAQKTEKGGRMYYTVGKTADVAADFTCMKTSPSAADDLIRVTVSVTNTGAKKATFALKAVFDTVLGEKTGTHFSTAQTRSVNRETQYLTMQNEKWITSEGGGSAVQFLLFGAGITSPSAVTLANKNIISLPLWVPVVSSSQTFDNVISYDNSALAINWNSVSLDSRKTMSVVFYIAVAADGDHPAGAAFLDALSGDVKAAEMPALKAPDAVPKAVPAAVSKPYTKADVKFDVESITDDQLDPEYIRALINKINALEDNDTTLNRDEILRLNAELDAILEKLRQQQ